MSDEIKQESDFERSPAGWAQRWQSELSAARDELKKWHGQGEKIVRRYLDEREAKSAGQETRWNLFTSSIEVKQASLYGQTPKVTVSRRFADARDDVARVAAEMYERMLNSDFDSDGDSSSMAFHYALEDRLLPGLSVTRVRYEAEFEPVPETPPQLDPATGMELAPAIPATERKASESVETDYVNWKDFLWSPARIWPEVRWVAFRAEMTRDELEKRFGKELGRLVPLNAKRHGETDDAARDADPWARAEVWEIWSKEEGKVFWFVEGMSRILDMKDDPLGLDGFFPCQRPMVANSTTTKMIPRPDFLVAQDLYNEVDDVSSRITLLEHAIRVVGMYDATNTGLRRMLDGEAAENEMIPVSSWAMFAEKGGLRGQVDWFPLEQVVNAMTALRDYRTELVDALYQITGMSDIMRGQASTAGTTATEQSIKAKFGSIRLQRLQDEFARFVTDLQKLKAEIIAKHFDPETILKQSNAQFTFDAQMAQQAAQLIKSGEVTFRIEVKPEAISLTDFAALKSERMEVLSGLTMFLQAMAPLAQQMPTSVPFLLQMLQWTMSGIRGASQIEGILDQAIAQAQQAAAAPKPAAPPDPKVQQLQMKGQLDLQKIQAETQADLMRAQMDAQTEDAKQRSQMEWNLKEEMGRRRLDIAMPKPAPVQTNGPGGFPPLGGRR